MAYPPYLARITHFAFDAIAGIDSPNPTGVDAELDGVLETLNQQGLFIRRITTADGLLKGVAAATALSLAGSQNITATASQTAFTTTIVWDSSFSVSSVLVFIAGLRVTPSAVADSGGFLQVTLAAQTVGTVVTIMAFSAGAGILTQLMTAGSATLGAHLVAIEDAGGYTSVVTQEAATQELYSHTQGATGKTWLEGVLVMSGYLAKAGGTMVGDITMTAPYTIKGLPASAANGQAVRHEQFTTLQASITGISSTFMPKSGGTFTGPVSFNSQVVSGIPTPTNTDHAASKGYVDTTLASFGGLPVGTLIDYAAATVPTGWLACDGAAVLRSAYASLFSVIGTTWGVGDGVTTFNVPDFRGRGTIGSGTGSGLTARALAATGGEETHVLVTGEMAAHTHTYTWGQIFGSGGSAANGPGVDSPYLAGTIEASTTTSSVGSGTAHNNMQPFVVATKLIKY